MEEPALRLAELRDARALAEVQVAAWQATYRGLIPARVLEGYTVERRAPRWREILSGGGLGRTWVAVGAEDVPLGFASTGPARDPDLDADRAAELLALYLRPDLVGRGVGRRLLERALEDLRQRGYQRLVLWVLDGNDRAERFYARAGLVAERSEVKVVDGAELPHTRLAREL